MITEIIVIDDNVKKTDPFIREIQKSYPDYIVHDPFSKADNGVKYILENLNKKMIVFLDCRFDEGIEGITALKQIREKTSLLFIVMMSANKLNQFNGDDLHEMVNCESLYFIDNKVSEAIKIISKINLKMNSTLNCVLEQWAINNSEISNSKPFVIVGDKSYTMRDLLQNIRNQTEFGIQMEKNILSLTIRLLVNNLETV